MKKYLSLLITILLFILNINFVYAEDVTKVTLNNSSLNMALNTQQTLKATITPTNATNKSLTWTSSNSKVASVDSNGVVTALSSGTANITVKTNNNKSATCKITVIENKIIFISNRGKDAKNNLTSFNEKTTAGIGDAILIENNGKYGLIDTQRGSVSGCYPLKKYLKDHGITELEFLIITHWHNDHVGCLNYKDLSSDINIKNIFYKEPNLYIETKGTDAYKSVSGNYNTFKNLSTISSSKKVELNSWNKKNKTTNAPYNLKTNGNISFGNYNITIYNTSINYTKDTGYPVRLSWSTQYKNVFKKECSKSKIKDESLCRINKFSSVVNQNAESLVIGITINGYNVLTTGDSFDPPYNTNIYNYKNVKVKKPQYFYNVIHKYFKGKTIDIYKVPHHGIYYNNNNTTLLKEINVKNYLMTNWLSIAEFKKGNYVRSDFKNSTYGYYEYNYTRKSYLLFNNRIKNDSINDSLQGIYSTGDGTYEFNLSVKGAKLLTSNNNICIYEPDNSSIHTCKSLLTINPNGGVYNKKSSITYLVKKYGDKISISNPTRTGYKFAGWKRSGGGSSLSGTKLTMGYANTTLKATWEINSYTLTINPNGGTYNKSTSNTTSILKYNSTMNISTPTRTGYTFTGWTVYGTGSKINGNTFTMGSSNATLKANWKLNTYTVTINPNGGTYNKSTSNTTISLNYGESKTIENPTRDGYTFSKWEKSCTGCKLNNNKLTMGSSNITLKAVWTANDYSYIVNYYLQNEDGTYDLEESNSTKEGTYGTKVTPTVKTYQGFTSPQVKSITIDSDNSKNIIDYKYTRNKYNLTVTIPKTKKTSKVVTTNNLYYDTDYELPTVEIEGYNFVKWENTSGRIADNIFTISSSDATVTGVLEAINYTINYSLDGGTLENSVNSYTIESNDIEIPTPVKEGYTFTGWSTSESSTSTLNYVIKSGSVGDILLIANYEENKVELIEEDDANVKAIDEDLLDEDSLDNPSTFTDSNYKFIIVFIILFIVTLYVSKKYYKIKKV